MGAKTGQRHGRDHVWSASDPGYAGLTALGFDNQGSYFDITANSASPLYAGGINLRDLSGGGLNLLSSTGMLLHVGDITAAVVYPGGPGTPIVLAHDDIGSGGGPAVVIGMYPADDFRIYNRATSPLDGSTENMFVVKDYIVFLKEIQDLNDGDGLKFYAWSSGGVELRADNGGGLTFNDHGGGGTFFNDFDGGGFFIDDDKCGGIWLNSGAVDDSGGGEIRIQNQGDGSGGGIFISNRTGGASVGSGDGQMELRNEGSGDMILKVNTGYLNFVGLPTSTPGGTNRIWRDALGYVRIT